MENKKFFKWCFVFYKGHQPWGFEVVVSWEIMLLGRVKTGSEKRYKLSQEE